MRNQGYGPVDLLIFQGTGFCNIDCKYCYLPDRLNKKIISIETIETAITNVLKENLVKQKLSILWHAGEPLIIPSDYYAQIFDRINALVPSEITIQHHIQTNTTLINQDWCNLFKKYKVRVGISIDGPQQINDFNRLTRSGKSTFDMVRKGVDCLKNNDLTFHAIAVVTYKSLPFANEIFDFFQHLGVYLLALNVEEIEGSNHKSSLADSAEMRKKVYDFFYELNELNLNSRQKILIREFNDVKNAVLQLPLDYYSEIGLGQLVRPWGIIDIDVDGNFSTFSPELLGQKSDLYGDFILGNVHSTSFREAYETEKFRRMFADIISGIDKCRQRCQYFSLCGGGAPSNKYYENGTFDSAETMYCKYAKQVPIDVVLDNMDRKIIEFNL